MLKKLGLIFVAMTMCVALGYGQAAAATEIVNGGIGDELNGIYDVRVGGDTGRSATGWQNFFVIENTSGNWTAFHLRLRSHKCSIEVWDHVILLSPYDVFWFALDNQQGDGNVRIFSSDNDTLLNSGIIFSPLVGNDLWEDHLSQELGASDMTYGHVEAIGMFQLQFPADWFPEGWDEHDLSLVVKDLFPLESPDGHINVYDVLAAAYYEFSAVLTPQEGDGWITRNPADLLINVNETVQRVVPGGTDKRMVIDCDNVLAGNYIWGDLESAEMGMENMIALEDFRTDDSYDPDVELSLIHRDGHYSGAIVFPPENVNIGGIPPSGLMPDYWYTSPAWYLNPDYATQVGPTLRDGDALAAAFAGNTFPWKCDGDLQGRFNDIWSHYDVDLAFSKYEVWYNYFQEDPFGGDESYTTEVFLVFKTKYLNQIDCEFPMWNSEGWPESRSGVAAYLEVLATEYWGQVCDDGELCLWITAWDMDENTWEPGDPGPSPGIFRYPQCIEDETNIMKFTTDPLLVSSPVYLYSPFKMGHFRIADFWNYGFRYATLLDSPSLPLPVVPGLYGIVYFRHTFGAEDFIRSAMAEWHYRYGAGSD